MPRALWTGSISFGLVNIPVKLYRATASASAKSISFHLLHDKCGTRIKNKRWCPHCDEEVDWQHVVKGYEVSKGRYVRMDPSELDEVLPHEDFAAVSIDSFAKLSEVDPIYYDRAYYVSPEGSGSSKAYVLLDRALEESKRVAIARVILRTRSHLAVLRPQDGHLLLSTMYYANEVVDAADVPALPDAKQAAHADKRQLEAALQLVDSMTVKWDPSKYKDEYAAKVEKIIEEKLSTGEVTTSLEAAPSEAEGGKVVNLLDALRRSVEARGQAPASEQKPSSATHKRRPKRARTQHHAARRRSHKKAS